MNPHLSLRVHLFVWLACTAMALLTGCASVDFDHGTTRLDNKALLFGKVALERDGQRSVLSTFSTSVVLRNIATPDEPGLITKSFEADGSFYWSLAPGHYQISFVLNPYSDGFKSFSFTVPRAGTAYYFGDLTFRGDRQFQTVSGANIRNVRAVFDDTLAGAKAVLLRKNPQLVNNPVEKVAIRDMTDPAQRWLAYSDVLSEAAPCCRKLADMNFRALPASGKQSYTINQASPSYQFAGGRSRFVALKLPQSGSPYSIAIRSVVTPSNLPGTGRLYIFAPEVMLLDQDFKVVALQRDAVFAPVPASMMPPRSASLQAQLGAAELDQASYLVLHTSRKAIETDLNTWRPGFIPVAGGVIPTGLPASVVLEPAISGEIEVTVTPQQAPAQ